ncbi:TBC1 domain family member 5-like protein B-like [Iris pallida]|uniref:TBC1 domain family member 5-like protein B-like n=1 Tax=Iris pallida TaxID=29817 RepID=A0AAX6F8K6_IRIPA|nr:TBC1 domain family member 5-like protein B-like [Iris pallida]
MSPMYSHDTSSMLMSNMARKMMYSKCLSWQYLNTCPHLCTLADTPKYTRNAKVCDVSIHASVSTLYRVVFVFVQNRFRETKKTCIAVVVVQFICYGYMYRVDYENDHIDIVSCFFADSTWSRFFRSAELEKTVDQDLSRLYPEHGSYFQTPACQAMLRRILLLWCLRHPEYGYRQGMHELLAPLLYVLHIDLLYLSQIRALNEDYFNDEFDEMPFPVGDPVSNYRFTKATSWDLETTNKDDNCHVEGAPKVTSIDDLDPETKNLFLLSDAYGVEGELGVILSERFIEHDAYCMFDSLMSGAHGVIAMADFFAPSPVGSSTGLPPVIEASSALYHLLSIIDSSLHNHLVELGVEPQYFALRWLRVLFGREFSLDGLLLIWDELFYSSNASSMEDEADCSFKILSCPRGVFIASMAVSMLLHLRSSLLATEIATCCLQRLLNFPNNIEVKKLIEQAKSWLALAHETNISSSLSHTSYRTEISRVHSVPTGSASPKPPNQLLPDSYWEEKWRVLHKEQAVQKNGSSISRGKIKALLGGRFSLSRTESDPSPAKRVVKSSSARRRLLEEFSDVNSKLVQNGVREPSNGKDHLPLDMDVENVSLEGLSDQNITGRTSDCTVDETCLSGENSSVFSTANSPHNMGNDHENDSDKSSVSSNSFVADGNKESNQMDEVQEPETSSATNSVTEVEPRDGGSSTGSVTEVEHRDGASSATISVTEVEPRDGASSATSSVTEVGPRDEEVKQGSGSKDRKVLSGRFQWLFRFGRGSGEGNLDKCSSSVGNASKEKPGNSTSNYNSSGDSERTEVGDKKVVGTLKNLGQSMLDNIQVIESVFQHDRGQAGKILGGKGQATTMAALKELRKISNLLSEM